MKEDRQSHPEKVKQSSLHVNCLMSQQSGSQGTAHTSAQIIITDGKKYNKSSWRMCWVIQPELGSCNKHARGKRTLTPRNHVLRCQGTARSAEMLNVSLDAVRQR